MSEDNIYDLAALRRDLRGSGGGGTSGGMEVRVAALEAHVGHIQSDVAALKADVSRLKDDVGTVKTDLAVVKATMASKGFIVAAVLGTGAVLGVLTTFAPALQHLLGLKP